MRGVRWLLATCGVLASLALAACSNSQGPHLQNGPTPPSTAQPTTSAATSAAVSTSTSATPSPAWSPPAYGSAEPAVRRYLALIKAYQGALHDPADAPLATIRSLAAGQAQQVFLSSVTDERAHGLAFRGTPDRSRVLVVSNGRVGSERRVVLSDCPLISKTTPWVEYTTSTGRPVSAGADPKTAPPFEATITVLETQHNTWIVSAYHLDGSRTCTR